MSTTYLYLPYAITRDAAARDRAYRHLLTHRGDTRTTTRRIIDRLSDWRDATTHYITTYATAYLATIATTH